jgi:hypothetical protein
MLPFDRSVGSAMRVQTGVACLAALLAAAGCGVPGPTGFSPERAGKHVRMLATAFGSRPTGSQANGRARDYIVAELRQAGFEVRLQEAHASTNSGVNTPLVNIIATRPGRQAESVALVSHYDSPPDSRGAADDGLGVAVCLEAGRALAERSDPRYSLLVALTDGEELGLMGARALRESPEFSRVRAFLNFEAAGTSGPPRLFQAGPGNSWLTAVWAASAPHPSGSSFFTEVYRRLPNDTDFSVLAPAGPPGLNFAPIGNTFAYHTRLDTPARLESATLRRMGDTAVAVVGALDAADIAQRSAGDGTYFDVAGRAAFAYTGGTTRIVAAIVFVLGLLAALKAFLAARAEVGTARLVVTGIWALLGTGVVFGALYAGCALLRLGTGLHQPWYAQANVFLVFLVSVGLGAVWLVVLLGRVLPVMVAPSSHPSCVWALTLPVWMGLLAFLQLKAPGVGYLFAFPLLSAAVLVLALPVRSTSAGRWVGVAAAGVSTLLWMPLVWPLLEFMVGLTGSIMPTAPGWLFPAFAIAAVSAMAPSLAGLSLGRQARLVPAGAVTSLLALAVLASAWVLAVEPAYTAERPERRSLRYVQDMLQQKAFWEAATREQNEAPVGTDASAPRDWQADDQAPAVSVPLSRVSGVHRYRTRASGLVAPPLDTRGVTLAAEGASDVWIEATAVPLLEGTGVAFVLPWGVRPTETSLKGAIRDGRWRAIVMPAPPSGVTLRVRLPHIDAARMSDARIVAIVHGAPGGNGWQRLPPWLPQDAVVWSAESWFILPWPTPVPSPVAAVRQ